VLGVNESTLRRWADAGQIRSFRTPGGHRRFSEDDLLVMTLGQDPPQGSLYTHLGQLTASHIRRGLQRRRGKSADWYQRISGPERERLRGLGKRLVGLISEFLARGGQSELLVAEAQQVGREYGRELAAEEFTFKDTVSAFTFFRKSLDESVIELVQRSSLSAEEVVDVWELLSGLADTLLTAIAESYSEKEPALSATVEA